MKKNTNFLYTNDNKQYHTYNYYTKNYYGSKVFKVCIDAGFSCPNRDGSITTGGCVFCSERGSGDMILQSQDLQKQIDHGFKIMRNKWPHAKAIAYFQSYTNTHGSLQRLKDLYEPFFYDDRFIALDIATRSDCLDDEKIAWFKEMNTIKEVNFEIGLQSIHHETSLWMNRGHDTESVGTIVKKLKKAGLKVCLHIINGFPNETIDMMLETAKYCAEIEADMIKIHMLHITKNTPLGDQYETNPISLLSKEDYIDLVVRQLEVLPPEMVIARLTGDAMAADLLEPMWTLRKVSVLNDIDKLQKERNSYQGKLYKKNPE